MSQINNKTRNSDAPNSGKNTVHVVNEKKTPGKNKLYHKINIMLVASLIGLILGGTIGFFTLPVIGAPIGAILGGCSPFITIIIIGLSRLFTNSREDEVTFTNMPVLAQSDICIHETKPQSSPENEPITIPFLFNKNQARQPEVILLSNEVTECEEEYSNPALNQPQAGL